MTIDQLNKLSDEEARERIANILFPQFPTYWHGKVLRHRYPSGETGQAFNYPDDLNAAFTLVEKLKEDGHSVNISRLCFGFDTEWCVDVRKSSKDKAVIYGQPLARAICLSFLAREGG